MSSGAERVAALAAEAERVTAGGPLAQRAVAIRARLDGPLRVAIAGRVKAGKSTLLNALVGERLAPTDAGECTRIVSWYRRGPGYKVEAALRDGTRTPLAFKRVEGTLRIELGSLNDASISALDVSWPASTLERYTLVDTPGLASLRDENSLRTREFLSPGAGPPDADAVVYLMRHVHRADVEFLGSFMDHSVSGSSPVNALAVLSRADEIGAGRLDAMDSAARIAARYRADPQLRALASTVVPLAGLLAETGLTLREDEAAALRAVAGGPPDEVDRMLLSADAFCETSASELIVERRRDLLDRLGMFGIRLAVSEIRAGRATTAAELARLLVQRSGLAELQRLLAEHFQPRARILQARAALGMLRALASDLKQLEPVAGDRLDREAERIEAGATEFAQLRVAHLVLSGAVRVDEEEREEIERVLLAPTPVSGLGAGGAPGELRSRAVSAIERWRTRGSDPLADPALAETCETMARTYEAAYASISG